MNDSSSQDDLYNSLKIGLSETEFAPAMQALEIPCRREFVNMPHPQGAAVALILKVAARGCHHTDSCHSQ